MKLHRNAALSWQGRRRLARRVLQEGWTLRAAAEAAGVSVRCARKWVARYRAEGASGLCDRSSAPRRVANRTPQERVEAIMALRRLRFIAAEIAEVFGMALSTVSAILRRVGMGRLGRLGLEEAVRYERSRPGELVHVDVRRLGRIQGGAGKRVRGGIRQHSNPRYTDAAGNVRRSVGWEYVHIAITTTRDSPTPRCSPTRRRPLPSASSVARSPSTAATACASSACSRTTAGPTAQRSMRLPAARSASATCERVPTAHKPTGRQSASSALSCRDGRTAPSTARAANGQQLLTAGSGTTTIAGDTQHSATNPGNEDQPAWVLQLELSIDRYNPVSGLSPSAGQG